MEYKSYSEIHQDSVNNPVLFWKERLSDLEWIRTPGIILDQSEPTLCRWFPDGLLNITHNCIDRHARTNPEKIAFIYEGPIAKEYKTMTYLELHDNVSRLAQSLADLGLNKGDTAMIYMPMVIESAICMLACARIGVIHSVVFGGFSSKELANRIHDCKPKVVLSASCGLEPHKIVDFPHIVRDAKTLSETPDLKVVYYDRAQKKLGTPLENEYLYQELIQKSKPSEGIIVESTHPLYILYTSGTTGQPKGIYRDVGGSAMGIMMSMELGFNFSKDSIIFATSDIGWVVGHSYMVYGPLLWGATTIFYEGKPTNTPDATSYFRLVEKHKVTVLYTSPTAMRTIRKEDPDQEMISKFDLSSLEVVGMVGERTDIYTYEYIKKLVPKNCLYNDTYWQTETGWFLSANFYKPQRFPTKGGSCTKAYPGWDIKIKDEARVDITTPKVLGHVVIKLPTPPGFMLGLWNNKDYFLQKYMEDFPGYYYTGDAGYFDDDAYLHIVTRTDDIINVSGHRLSTAQMEEAITKHVDVAEAAVVGIKDTIKGQSPFAIVVLKKNVLTPFQTICKEIVNIVREEIGPVAGLHYIYEVQKIPKTRSGKVLRGTILKIIDNEHWKYPETIEDAETLEDVKNVSLEFAKVRKLDIVFDDQVDKVNID